MVWDEDRRPHPERPAGANNLSFSTDDEFYKATREALPWADPDCDRLGGDPGRMLLAAAWVECLLKLAPTRSATVKDSEQGPFKFLTRCLHLKK